MALIATSRLFDLLFCVRAFSDEMSKFLEPAALRSMPPQVKERLHAGATEGISWLQKNIELETGYVKRYQQLLKELQGTAPIAAVEPHH